MIFDHLQKLHIIILVSPSLREYFVLKTTCTYPSLIQSDSFKSFIFLAIQVLQAKVSPFNKGFTWEALKVQVATAYLLCFLAQNLSKYPK